MKTTSFLGGLRGEMTDGRLPKAIKGVLWCILHGMGVGGFIGGVLGVGFGALIWLVGAFIGGPVGLLVGAIVGGVCGLCGGVLGGRWGWPLGGGIGTLVCVVAAFKFNNGIGDGTEFWNGDFSLVTCLFLAGAFALGVFLGGYSYRRVWEEKPGIQAAAFQEWRGRLLLNGYHRTTLLDRVFAGWAIIGTTAALATVCRYFF